MATKNILVTGAGGFIGYQLCNYLTDLGHRVIGVDLKYPADLKPPRFDAIKCDYRDWPKMNELLANKNVVFHLACAHLGINLDEKEYWDNNVNNIKKLLKLVRSYDVQKFIHVSSIGVYGKMESWPADEETPCYPQSIYGETKLAGEVEAMEFFKKTGLPIVILRPTWVYGHHCPRMRKLYKTLRNRTFTMIGNGQNLRHPIYILDLLEAFGLVMENDGSVGELIIIGGEHAITTQEVIHNMCTVFELKKPFIKIPKPLGKLMAVGIEHTFRFFNKEPPISGRSLEFFNTNNAYDISKSKQILNFKPEYSFEKGLLDCREELESLFEKGNGKVVN